MNMPLPVCAESQVLHGMALFDRLCSEPLFQLEASLDDECINWIKGYLFECAGILESALLTPVLAKGGCAFLMPGKDMQAVFSVAGSRESEGVGLTAEALGIVATLYALQHMHFKNFDHKYLDSYFELREVALEHSEANQIQQIASWL